MLFLVLPTISRRIGQSLQRCDEYDDDTDNVQRFLSADVSITCDSQKYYAMRIYAAIML